MMKYERDKKKKKMNIKAFLILSRQTKRFAFPENKKVVHLCCFLL
jgi:hypothetical protein